VRVALGEFGRTGEVDFEILDPDLDFRQFGLDEFGIGSSYRGPEGLAQAVAEFQANFEDFHVEPEEFIDAGECVVVFVRNRGRGRSGGVPIDQPVTQVWKIRDGKAVQLHIYSDREEALEAVGLSE
jgi:ketosteroid isomerase-like protein